MAVSSLPLTAPPRLLDLSVDFCISHVETFCHTGNGGQKTPKALRPDVVIPASVADMILAKAGRRRLASPRLDGFVGVFSNTEQASLQQVDLNPEAVGLARLRLEFGAPTAAQTQPRSTRGGACGITVQHPRQLCHTARL